MMNSIENLEGLFAPMQMWMKPMQQANKMAVEQLEKVVDLQMTTWQKYVDISMQQMKAAAEIKNIKDWQDFVNQQMEMAGTMRQQWMEDNKAFTEMGLKAKEEMTELVQNNVKEFSKATASTTKAKQAA